jgi:hypothetical protein
LRADASTIRIPEKPRTHRAVGCAVTPFDLRKTRPFSRRVFRRTHYDKSASKAPLSLANAGSQVPKGLWTLRPRGAESPHRLLALPTLRPPLGAQNIFNVGCEAALSVVDAVTHLPTGLISRGFLCSRATGTARGALFQAGRCSGGAAAWTADRDLRRALAAPQSPQQPYGSSGNGSHAPVWNSCHGEGASACVKSISLEVSGHDQT